MPANHKRKPQYEIRVGGKWRPVPEGSRVTPLKSGAALVLRAQVDVYFDKDEWRIVTVSKEQENG